MIAARRIALVTSLALLAATAPGCVAYKAATPSWFDGGGDEISPPPHPHTPAQRAHAIRRRAIIAAAVGAVELALGAAVITALATGNFEVESSDPDPVEGGSGVAGGIASAVGDYFAALLVGSALGAGLTISGLGDLGCGVHDLVTSSTCDAAMKALDETHPRPTGPEHDDAGDDAPVGAVGSIKGVSPRTITAPPR